MISSRSMLRNAYVALWLLLGWNNKLTAFDAAIDGLEFVCLYKVYLGFMFLWERVSGVKLPEYPLNDLVKSFSINFPLNYSPFNAVVLRLILDSLINYPHNYFTKFPLSLKPIWTTVKDQCVA